MRTRLKLMTLLTSVVFISGCSSSGSNEQTSDVLTTEQRRAFGLAQAISAPPQEDTIELWSCISENGDPLGYTFHRNGEFQGGAANLLLGQEMHAIPNTGTEPFIYQWTAASESSLLLDASQLGMQVEWTDIAITVDGMMTANKSNRGRLVLCQRGDILKSSIGGARKR